ncbi:MAG: 30S ribosomal protein S8 [Candidatus Vogelbacteria bacterium CG10_big_fil_rev_8_21_14_0_10_45_14]|uniref:Small ribosomal subunit protein uS8 n=1 Tax=Candidatus Vogelbacteria bacterium CG10_big_fil_rev_8_21_14_0_10_45_14 TaxID=1975042 RepID=A0A2H0RJU6_9BACT|nr:MAG: 30S ribosomal protein S8 [Candidatus Vogelbacteria bacterium CG10_big_fil_rev_8_21_14_0_10_45_14]
MVGDPVGDFLIRIKNASCIGKASTSVPYSKLKESIATLLVREGYLDSLEVKGKPAGKRTLDVVLLYPKKNVSKVRDVKRISKPGRRVYISAALLRAAERGMTAISTSRGLMPAREAKKQKLGGELLFTIW